MREGPNTRAQQQSWWRDAAGVIVTVREQTTGELRTVHRSGLLVDALRDTCDTIDKLEGTWLIATISTPRTIAIDLSGRDDRKGSRPIALRPEATMLAKVRRADLLENNHTVTAERGQMAKRRGRARKPAA